MVWAPVRQVFDPTQAIDNLLGFLAAYQTDALAWANDGDALPPILKFYNSARVVTIFPSLTILQTYNRSQAEDIVETEFGVIFECVLQGGDQDALASTSRIYAMAIDSMLTNMAETTLFQNSIITTVATLRETEVEFDLMDRGKKQFIQLFQMKAVWDCGNSAE